MSTGDMSTGDLTGAGHPGHEPAVLAAKGQVRTDDHLARGPGT